MSRLRRRALILLYHRVAEVPTDPQLLCVTPDNFARHMEIVRTTCNPISLRQLTSGLQNKRVPRRSVLVTFDDGYADNLYNAKPILERYDIPAVVFVAAGYVGSHNEYWWDELEKLLLRPGSLPDELELKINGNDTRRRLDEPARIYSEADYREHADWSLNKRSVPTGRHGLYLDLYKTMRPLGPERQTEMLESLRAWSGCMTGVREAYQPMTAPEVQRLRDGNLVAVGAHTISHPILSGLTVANQQNEILGSRDLLREITGEPVTSFAYPYGGDGDYTAETVDVVRQAGFECAFSTASGLTRNDSEHFRLPRIWVRNWSADTFERRLHGWWLL